jgi:2-methylcitrate dehydratase PrpD
MDRRSFLCRSAVMTASLVGGLPNPSFAQTINSSVASGSPSISRQFARWVAGLRYQDLPPAVIDRARGVTLHALASALQGYSAPGGREAVQIVSEQYQGVPNGATILVHGIKATKGDAAFANAEMILAGGK